MLRRWLGLGCAGVVVRRPEQAPGSVDAPWVTPEQRLALFQKLAFAAIGYYVVTDSFVGAYRCVTTHVFCLLCIGASWLSANRFQAHRGASWLLLFGLNASLAVASLFDSTIDSPGLWTISLLPMISACVLDAKAIVTCTAVAFVEIVALGAVGYLGLFEPEIQASNLDLVIIMVLSLGVHSLMAYMLSNDLVARLRMVARRRQLIKTAHQVATKANDEKTEFLARMSHELRTPMNGLLGMMDFLQGRETMRDQKDAMDTVQRCGESLLGLLNDILDLSNVEAGHFELCPVPVDIVTLVRDVQQLFGAQAELLQVDLKLESEFDSYWCVGDDTRIRQVISNILGNALKFCQGKPITIRIAKKIDEPTDAKLPWVIIEVVDQGIGMSEQEQGRVFEQYEQVESTSTRGKGGTGLGLSISNHLVQKMGGRIELESAVGQGSTFRVLLPLEPCVAPSRRNRTTGLDQGDRARLSSAHILVVDDNAINQRVARLGLEKLDCTVVLAGNGREAVACASAESFDLILMDIRMPEMDGLQATRAIKTSPGPNRHTPIIALTANAFAQDVRNCLNAGMVDHLAKPMNFKQVRKALLRHFPDRREQERQSA